MIKKYLLGLGITIISLISFSNAGKTQVIGLDSLPSAYNDDYNLTFLKGGGVLSNFLGQGKSILAFSGDSFFWWSTNGQPYFYSKGSQTVQGFFGQYWSCNVLTGLDSTPSGCTSNAITGDYQELFKGFFSQVSLGDYAYYNLTIPYNSSSANGSSRGYNIQVCFSSQSVGKSLCFRVGNCYNSISSSACIGRNYGSLVNSQDLQNLSYGLISNSWIGYAPGQKGYGGGGNIEGGSNTSINVSLTGNLLYNSCTKGYILNKLDGILGDQFCYAGTYDTGLIDNNFNGNTYIYDYGLKYRDLYKLSKSVGPYYSSYNDWYLGHYDSIKRYKLGQISQNPFIGEPVAVYSYFNNLYSNYGFDVADLSTKEFSSYGVLNYCNLLFSDSSSSSAYTGQYFQYLCDSLNNSDGSTNITTGVIGDPDESFEVLPPGFDYSNNNSGVIVSVDWSGTLSGNTDNNFEGRTFINDFYQKLQSVFQKPTKNIVGIVPGYILVFMVAIILFRFLSH